MILLIPAVINRPCVATPHRACRGFIGHPANPTVAHPTGMIQTKMPRGASISAPSNNTPGHTNKVHNNGMCVAPCVKICFGTPDGARPMACSFFIYRRTLQQPIVSGYVLLIDAVYAFPPRTAVGMTGECLRVLVSIEVSMRNG